MTKSEEIIKGLEANLLAATQKLKQELGQIRGNRPSSEMLQDVRVNIYDQSLTIRELGSLSVLPPRTIQITLWDPEAIMPVMKAIEAAHLGLSASNDGPNIRATLSALGNERREELMKTVKKTAEGMKIQIRGKREEAMKQLKEAEANKEITEDDAFRSKEKIQKGVEKANAEVESLVDGKIAELGE